MRFFFWKKRRTCWNLFSLIVLPSVYFKKVNHIFTKNALHDYKVWIVCMSLKFKFHCYYFINTHKWTWLNHFPFQQPNSNNFSTSSISFHQIHNKSPHTPLNSHVQSKHTTNPNTKRQQNASYFWLIPLSKLHNKPPHSPLVQRMQRKHTINLKRQIKTS